MASHLTPDLGGGIARLLYAFVRMQRVAVATEVLSGSVDRHPDAGAARALIRPHIPRFGDQRKPTSYSEGMQNARYPPCRLHIPAASPLRINPLSARVSLFLGPNKEGGENI
jgi:hypothetical protein